MTLSVAISPTDSDQFAAHCEVMAASGFTKIWCPQVPGAIDSLVTIASVARQFPTLHFGTGIQPTWTRHPAQLAQSAVAVAFAAPGRFTLGIGVSHQPIVEQMYGMPYAAPVSHLEHYLSVLVPALRGEPVDVTGPFSFHGAVAAPPASIPLMVAALGPRALRITGEHCDGTLTFLTGPETLSSLTRPSIDAAASAAGRPRPTIVAGVTVAVTNHVDVMRGAVDEALGFYGMLPAYRAMMDREGAKTPADLSLIGDESAVDASLRRLFDAGADEVSLSIVGDEATMARTAKFLGAWQR
jgi:5,10-methylenetetrahydromethanopterin reductase